MVWIFRFEILMCVSTDVLLEIVALVCGLDQHLLLLRNLLLLLQQPANVQKL